MVDDEDDKDDEDDDAEDDDDAADDCDPEFVLPDGEAEPDLLTTQGRTRAVQLMVQHTYAAGLTRFANHEARNATIKALLVPHSQHEENSAAPYERPTLAALFRPLLEDHPPRASPSAGREVGMPASFYPPSFAVFIALGGYAVDKYGATPFAILALSDASVIDGENARRGTAGGRGASRKREESDAFSTPMSTTTGSGSEGGDSSFPPPSKFLSVQLHHSRMEIDKAKIQNDADKVRNERDQLNMGQVSTAFTMLERLLPHVTDANDRTALIKNMVALSNGAAANALNALAGKGGAAGGGGGEGAK